MSGPERKQTAVGHLGESKTKTKKGPKAPEGRGGKRGVVGVVLSRFFLLVSNRARGRHVGLVACLVV